MCQACNVDGFSEEFFDSANNGSWIKRNILDQVALGYSYTFIIESLADILEAKTCELKQAVKQSESDGI